MAYVIGALTIKVVHHCPAHPTIRRSSRDLPWPSPVTTCSHKCGWCNQNRVCSSVQSCSYTSSSHFATESLLNCKTIERA